MEPVGVMDRCIDHAGIIDAVVIRSVHLPEMLNSVGKVGQFSVHELQQPGVIGIGLHETEGVVVLHN